MLLACAGAGLWGKSVSYMIVVFTAEIVAVLLYGAQ